MNYAVLFPTNDQHLQDTQHWLQAPVQTFFATCNWEDRSLEEQELRLSAIANPDLTSEDRPLMLSLKVSQFFAAVNWDGLSLSRSVPVLEEPPALGASDADGFTLTDFSDLF
ncbi:hypothetical protein [Myxacorys almedinensis]|uniref:Uncharacterized protein n=1 Tax=Myxacorys almedinensis A TaxID=2690445 RepID=A0A8J7Z5P1_9CYAN|nr:hypothetical protein [Myxacorys almedinensis]NDJ19870.1 hypothetical protein [Myxacorys almedinensis A]